MESRECPACFDDTLDLVQATCKCGIRFCEPCTLTQVCECVRKGEVPMCLNSSECGQKMRRSEVMRLQVISVLIISIVCSYRERNHVYFSNILKRDENYGPRGVTITLFMPHTRSVHNSVH